MQELIETKIHTLSSGTVRVMIVISEHDVCPICERGIWVVLINFLILAWYNSTDRL